MYKTEAEAIAAAKLTRARIHCQTPAAVHKLWYSKRRFTWGFNFRQAAQPGVTYTNSDGSRAEVTAIVQ